MAKQKRKSGGSRKAAPVFDLGAQEIFATLMSLLDDTELIAENIEEALGTPPTASPTEYADYDSDSVYSDASSSDSRDELDSDLEFVEDDDAGHYFKSPD